LVSRAIDFGEESIGIGGGVGAWLTTGFFFLPRLACRVEPEKVVKG